MFKFLAGIGFGIAWTVLMVAWYLTPNPGLVVASVTLLFVTGVSAHAARMEE